MGSSFYTRGAKLGRTSVFAVPSTVLPCEVSRLLGKWRVETPGHGITYYCAFHIELDYVYSGNSCKTMGLAWPPPLSERCFFSHVSGDNGCMHVVHYEALALRLKQTTKFTTRADTRPCNSTEQMSTIFRH